MANPWNKQIGLSINAVKLLGNYKQIIFFQYECGSLQRRRVCCIVTMLHVKNRHWNGDQHGEDEDDHETDGMTSSRTSWNSVDRRSNPSMIPLPPSCVRIVASRWNEFNLSQGASRVTRKRQTWTPPPHTHTRRSRVSETSSPLEFGLWSVIPSSSNQALPPLRDANSVTGEQELSFVRLLPQCTVKAGAANVASLAFSGVHSKSRHLANHLANLIPLADTSWHSDSTAVRRLSVHKEPSSIGGLKRSSSSRRQLVLWPNCRAN